MEYLFAFILLFYLLSSLAYTIYFLGQNKHVNTTGYYLLIAGFISHCIAIIAGCLTHSGSERVYLPVHTLHETLSVAGASIVGVFLFLRYKYNLRILGIFAATPAAIIMIYASLSPQSAVHINKIFNNVWVLVHVVAIFVGEGALALAMGTGVLYLIQEYTIKAKKTGFFYKRLPSLNLLDNAGYTCLAVGFGMLSVGLILGIVYAKQVSGKFWSWTPKEIWSGITWLVYAILLHQRLTVGWRGRRAAIMAIIGFIILLFTFFGVNFFMETHHGILYQMP